MPNVNSFSLFPTLPRGVLLVVVVDQIGLIVIIYFAVRALNRLGLGICVPDWAWMSLVDRISYT